MVSVQKELKIKACCIIIVYFLLFSLFEKDTERLKLFFVIGLMRPETQITHTRGGRQSLALDDINTQQRNQY